METTLLDGPVPFDANVDGVFDYNMKPLKLGVEVTGIDLKKHIDNAKLFQRIKTDVYLHRLMVFRNQGALPVETLLAISGHFGTIFSGSFDVMNHPKSPSP